MKFIVRNITRDILLANSADLADTSEKRRTGLLKHDGLEPGEGLWIVPCESVHSFFMKFTIDVLYVDRANKVRGIRPRMKPWRVSACLPAHGVLELPEGTIEQTGTRKGDQLSFQKL